MAAGRHLILTLIGVASSAQLQGQCRLCAQPTTQRSADAPSGDVDLQIETDLSFDRLVLSGIGQGAATIRPSGANAAEGAVLEIGPRATVGTVLVHGEANRSVRVEIPHRIDLYSSGGARITLLDVDSDLPSSPHLDAAGNLSFRFGGRLIVTGNDDGQFRGDLPITVEYSVDASTSAGNLSSR
jgi:hypothetical protein